MSQTPASCRTGRDAPQPDRRGGFTLLEIILILTVMGILSALVFSRTNLGDVSPDARALEIRSQFHFVQLRAMKSATMYGISGDGANYWAFNGTDPGSAGNATMPIPLPGETGLLVSQADKNITMPAFCYAFDDCGIPYTCSAGSVPVKLAAPASLGVTVNGVTRNLTLTPETGYIPF